MSSGYGFIAVGPSNPSMGDPMPNCQLVPTIKSLKSKAQLKLRFLTTGR
jgi:hypothetical protein